MFVVNLCVKGYEVLLKRRIMLDTKNMYRLLLWGRSRREHLGQEKWNEGRKRRVSQLKWNRHIKYS